MKKSLLTLFLAIMVILPNYVCVFAESADDNVSDTANYISSLYDDDDPATFENGMEAFFIARSGISDKSVCSQYLSSVRQELDNNGVLTYNAEESIAYYSVLLLTLAVLGEDASDFYGYNIIEKIEHFDRDKILTTDVFSLPLVLYAVEGYKNEISDTTLKDFIINAIVSKYSENGEERGFDHWGYSTDTNAKIICSLFPYCDAYPSVKEIVDKTSEWLYSQMEEKGFNYNTASEWNSVNGDSTGLGLAFLAARGDRENADKTFNAVMGFKGLSQGAFEYMHDTGDNYFATKDAMEGLLEYSRLIAGKKSVYDISDTSVNMYRDVIDEIESISDAESAAAARRSYNALSPVFRKKVSNLDKLEAAEKEYSLPDDSQDDTSSLSTESSNLSSDQISSSPDSIIVSSRFSTPTNGKNTPTNDSSPIVLMTVMLVSSFTAILILLFVQRKEGVEN